MASGLYEPWNEQSGNRRQQDFQHHGQQQSACNSSLPERWYSWGQRERERMGSDRERILQQRDYRLCLDFKTMIGRKYPIIKVIRKSKHLHPDWPMGTKRFQTPPPVSPDVSHILMPWYFFSKLIYLAYNWSWKYYNFKLGADEWRSKVIITSELHDTWSCQVGWFV